MGFPTRIGIATGGYRRGDSNPGKVCIATDGYRCLEPPPLDPSLLGGGHGAVVLQPRPRTREDETEQIDDVQLALLAVALIEDLYE